MCLRIAWAGSCVFDLCLFTVKYTRIFLLS